MKLNMDSISIKWKIFAFLLIFCAILLVVLWLFQEVFLSDMYKLVRKSEMQKAIHLVEQNINSPNLSAILTALEEDKEILVKPTKYFAEPPRSSKDFRNKPNPETLKTVKEFILPDGKSVSFTFFAIITPVNSTVSTLELQLYMITLIMIVLSVGLALIISGRISKPIVHLNESAKRLAKGDYDTHFSATGFLEITELSETLHTAARDLSKTESLRRELMANISHDLRTPLALIYSYAEMMHDFPDEITPEQTQTIMDETKRLTSLVNDVLDVSRLETGTMELNLQQYNLTASIADTVERMSELVKKDGYTVSFTSLDDVYVTADEVKITQAFYNLLINAIHYCGNDQQVEVCQSCSNGIVKIQVIDHGDGISSENLTHIWDRYYKIDKKHKRAVTGTGIGLSIVKKILDLHGASYGVDSEIGKGSIFWFCLKAE